MFGNGAICDGFRGYSVLGCMRYDSIIVAMLYFDTGLVATDATRCKDDGEMKREELGTICTMESSDFDVIIEVDLWDLFMT